MPAAPRSRLSTAGAVLLGLLVVALPLSRGGVDWPVQLAAALGAAAALLLCAARSRELPRAGLALAAVLGVMALQLLPLPPALHAVSPEARRLFEGALGPLGLYPAARPLSLDPPATARELAKGAAALAAFLAAWLLGGGRRRRDILLLAFGALGVALALAVLGAALIGAQPLLAPRFPFVNPNHLAGAANLAAFAVLGLALRARGQARLLWLLAFAAVALLPFLSLSRGGIGAFGAGVVLFVLLGARRERPADAPRSRGRWALLAGVAGSLALSAWLALGPVLDELATLSNVSEETKAELWRPALQMVGAFPVVGIGRGAFETAFPAWKTEPAPVTFTHLENEWLQPLVELGVPAGLLLVGTLALLWLRAARRRDLSWAEVGLLAGTAAVALHNAVDFSLELLGVAIPFAAALGLLERGERGVPVPAGLHVAVAAVLGLAGLGGLALWRAQPTDADALAVGGAATVEAAVAAARTAARAHPADFVPQATAGARLAEAGRCGEAMPWLTRAMLLDPTAAEPHLHAARCLADAGQDRQARLEWRLAFAFGARQALAEAVARYPAVDDLLQVAPDTPDGLLALGAHLLGRRPTDAVVVYRRALDEYGDGRALVPLAGAVLSTGDAAGALELARRRAREAPHDVVAWRLASQVLVKLGDESGAEEALEQGLALNPGSPPLVAWRAERLIAARRFSQARQVADGMLARTPSEQVQRQLLQARALAGQERWGEAIERARAAVAIMPGTAGPLLALSGLATQAGRFDEAIDAVERAAGLPGQDRAALEQRLAALRAARDRQQERRLLEGR